MRKILTIAGREYRAMVATKAFLLSIVMMPILMFGGLFATQWLNKAGGIKERKILVWDGSKELYRDLLNSSIALNNSIEGLSGMNEDDGGLDATEKYMLEESDVAEVTDEYREEISQRIKDGELYAFVEIPADIFGPPIPVDEIEKTAADNKSFLNQAVQKVTNQAAFQPPSHEVIFRSQNSALSGARQWLRQKINELVKNKRLANAKIQPDIVRMAESRINVKGLGLFKRDASGSGKEEEETETLQAIFLPFGVMMLMFMVIFLAAQPSLESVLEEKSQKIAEVLLGSASTFQLMIGKLIGVVGGSLTVFSIYITGVIYIATTQDYEVPFGILPWFIVFQILGVFFFGALFMAVGASVNQLKEAQSMLLPIWMLMMSPMFVWFILIRDPNSPIAVGMSLFPPATPTTLMLRMATGQTIPMWQPIVGLVLMVISTLFVVHIAGRIFRVGILWQGKTPSIKEIVQWAFSTN